MFFFNNNNNNINNNNRRHNNRYVVPVPAVAPATSKPAYAGNKQQLAHAATNEAERHEQDQRMAARIARAMRQPVSSAALPLPMLPSAATPLPEPRTAPNQAGCLPTILAIFAVAWSLLSPRRTR